MYFIPPPITIKKIKKLHDVLRGQSPQNKWLHNFVACPPISPSSNSPLNLYVFPHHKNITTMITQHTKFPLMIFPPEKPNYQTVHYPTANFAPFSTESIVNPNVITAFDT